MLNESETQRLLAADITEPAQSPWRAQVLVENQDQKTRSMVDYSITQKSLHFVVRVFAAK